MRLETTATPTDTAAAADHFASELAARQLAALTPDELGTLQRLKVADMPIGDMVDHLLDLADEAIDPETGEVRVSVAGAIDSLNLSLAQKVQAYHHVAERLKAEADAMGELASSYRAKSEKKAEQVKGLKLRLQMELVKLKTEKVKTPTVTAYLQNSPPSVELLALTDEEVPDEYCAIERRVSMSKLSAALKSGAKLAFARFAEPQKHLRFR